MLLYLALNSFHQIFSIIQFNPEVRLLLLDAEGGLILSSDNPFNFHTEISSLLTIF